jgi:gas vesicle protein
MATFADLYMDYLKRSRRKNNVVGKVFFFSALSAAVGAGVALLTTPKTGEQNRKDLVKIGKQVGKQALDLEKTAEDKFDALKDRAESRFQELRSELSGRVGKLRERLGEGSEEVVADVKKTIRKVARPKARTAPVRRPPASK